MTLLLAFFNRYLSVPKTAKVVRSLYLICLLVKKFITALAAASNLQTFNRTRKELRQIYLSFVSQRITVLEVRDPLNRNVKLVYVKLWGGILLTTH